MRINTLQALLVATLGVGLAPGIEACPAQNPVARMNAYQVAPGINFALMRGRNTEGAQAASQSANNSPLVVGMWEVTLMAGGQVYDHAFQQFTSDGLELQNSGLVPPNLGNLCLGVWSQLDAKTIVLKHKGWTFDGNGNFAGTFVMTATIQVSGPGSAPDTYSGTFVGDIILPSGLPDPAQHVTGTLSATRITVN